MRNPEIVDRSTLTPRVFLVHRLWQISVPFAVLLSLSGHPLSASTISYTGNLRSNANVTSCGSGCVLDSTNSDADYAQYAALVVPIAVLSSSTLQAISFSYGGGTNAAGMTIANSGFESYFSLFDASGNFLASTYYGTTCPSGANTNPTLGGCYDEELDAGPLAPGTYSLALTAYENLSFAENLGTGTLSDGFIGLGGLNFGEDLHYAFDVTLTPSSAPVSPVPEPSGEGLLFGLAGIVVQAVRQWRRAA